MDEGKLLVFVLDDDESLRNMLATYLELSGRCTVCTMETVRELQRHSPDLPRLFAAILDINLGAGKPTGVDAYRWLRSQGFKGRIIFLTGHARSHPSGQQAYLIGDAEVLEKPTGMFQLESAIFEAA